MPSVAEGLASTAAAKPKQKPDPAAARRRFRASLAWKRVRFAMLAANAEQNGGTARCELCGAVAAPGESLHVDHIVALSHDWSKRLDRSNLQVLCASCNVGKLDGPPADFRKG